MKIFLALALVFGVEAFAKPRTLQVPKSVAAVDSIQIRRIPCISPAVKVAVDGGFVLAPNKAACEKVSFLVEVRACAVYEDGGKSLDCGVGRVRVLSTDDGLQRLWDVAKPEWEKVKGY